MPVKIIKARTKVEAVQKKTLRVAAYCRVSTDEEAQESSFEVQQSFFHRLIEENPDWTLVKIYADQGISGTSLRKRVEFNQMLQDCRDGKIDLILAKSISRFARNTVDCLNIIREMKSRDHPHRIPQRGDQHAFRRRRGPDYDHGEPGSGRIRVHFKERQARHTIPVQGGPPHRQSEEYAGVYHQLRRRVRNR